jgi:DNA helicase-2/ATP-dependent DNA helicase PcrA
MKKYQRRYQHILVDEFQDTNTAQYALLKRLAAGHGNLFCVGDEDQSIYRFRGADWRNVRRFHEDYPESETILLEQNYRSTQIILDAAQAVIRPNPHRTHKALFTERRAGARLTVHEAYNEDEEAEFAVNTILRMIGASGRPQRAKPGDFAIMYRTNAQSRRIEEAFVRAGMSYRLVGATRFYARREVRDVIAYLRAVHNPDDSVSLLRIISVPPRGIGAKTVAALRDWAEQAGESLGAAMAGMAEGSTSGPALPPPPLAGRASRGVSRFADLLARWVARSETTPVADLMDLVLEESGCRDRLRDGSPEGEERWDNVLELRNVASEYPETTLSEFLEQVALVSEVDNLTEELTAPTLLTLHAAKGLEFPVVFIVGLEDGILPHRRSWDDPEQMAEERRLLYVGVTRAMDRVYLLHCFRRSAWGDAELGRPSRFLDDLPPALIAGAGEHLDRRVGRRARRDRLLPGLARPAQAERRAVLAPAGPSFETGQRVQHSVFGEGVVIESEPADGDEIITVAFEELGLKRLLASVAKLEAIGEG